MKIRTAAALSATVALIAGPGPQAMAVPFTPADQATRLPAAAPPLQTADAEQCQYWGYDYRPWTNANGHITEEVCWTSDPPTVHTRTKRMWQTGDEPEDYCTLTPARPSCVANAGDVKDSFTADFGAKRVTETMRYCADRCANGGHVYTFQ
ncbi:hypothetical protein GCM10023195_85740 [Actinoallomurus liliacearum]|uniref:Uncharacterized protein n=1 Tax=Actinoallomurus liliacearum TaxID=1080073 RepID=A0ABP8U1S6_9ACTN